MNVKYTVQKTFPQIFQSIIKTHKCVPYRSDILVKPTNFSLIGAVLEPYDWKEVLTKMRAEWKCVLIDSGG